MVIPNIFNSNYFIYLLQVDIWYFFQIKLFKWCVINVLTIMHIDTHYLELEYFIMTMLNPSKVSFSLCRFEALKIYLSIWITNAFCDSNMVKHILSILKMRNNNEFKKWKFMMSTLCKMGEQLQIKKVNKNRFKKKKTQHFKLLKTFSCYITYDHVV